jgi:putative toxin-antitoxin system antitoxin component (TIGR02293 family)
VNDIARPSKQAPRKASVTGVAPRRGRHSAQRRATHVAAKSDVKTFHTWSNPDQALKLFQTSVIDRVNIVKVGVPALYVNVLTACMGMPKDKFYRTIGLMRPTVDRKVRASKLLNQDESERVLGIARLVGQAQSLIRDSGRSGTFNAARWVAGWLDRPLPALGGKRPGEYMDTADGRTLVADILAQQQSGTYA